ncbi:hypothetical protein [Mycobacterium shimoidei]|jgi:hypothetical protein|uniref:Uncharacterized protein n=1 Tax=Mycobacterium shimoidei TaxID=29313 RepID=A0A1E3TE28_MYCSH|nr:hypothetical protein [Mycobacterium shimoidei]ODR12670.1 hypothetical protein BHQ16_14345 [Mycobacterium shimoidei]ORW81776.1 hypothetical protein AWC26_06945 [Mycobacterium shimoidei]SRX93767.1 hypothetical protein MSP7336_02010 [Mycobacterium shimoidei]
MGDVADNADKQADKQVEKKARKTKYVDHGWPTTDPDDHAVSELAADRVGALSPFGDLVFPLPPDDLPYVHPVTVVNR